MIQRNLDALERFTERKDIRGWARDAAFKAMVALVLWGDYIIARDFVNIDFKIQTLRVFGAA